MTGLTGAPAGHSRAHALTHARPVPSNLGGMHPVRLHHLLAATPPQVRSSKRAKAKTPEQTGRAPQGLGAWMRLHKVAVLAVVGTLLVSAAAVAVLTLRLDAAVAPAAKASPVIFAEGSDYPAINTAGFATLTVGTSATSASLSLSGVPGAAQVSLGNLLKITNQDEAQAYDVTLTRSTTLNAAITSLVVTVKDGTDTLATWDPKADASSATFTLPADTALDLSLAIVIADGTAVGGLGSFSMQVSMSPA